MKYRHIEERLKEHFLSLATVEKLQRQIEYLVEYLAGLEQEREEVQASYEAVRSVGVARYATVDVQSPGRVSDPTQEAVLEHLRAVKEIDKTLWETRKELREKRQLLKELRLRGEDMGTALTLVRRDIRYALEQRYQPNGQSTTEIALHIPCDESTLREHMQNAMGEIEQYLGYLTGTPPAHEMSPNVPRRFPRRLRQSSRMIKTATSCGLQNPPTSLACPRAVRCSSRGRPLLVPVSCRQWAVSSFDMH